MKQHYFLFIFFCLFCYSSIAQLPDGSTAPDFTVTDINGQSHTLSQYLDEGKTVFLKFFATWCGPCWSHHQSGALNELYESYGPGGTDELMVILIEADGRTNENCIFGPSGCNSSTQGDWTRGKSNPIANDHAVGSLYDVSYFPTIYGICPDGILTEVGQRSSDAYYDWHLDNCALQVSLMSKTDINCHGQNTGVLNLRVEGGNGNYTYDWSNGMTGNPLRGVPAGSYTVTVSSGPQETIAGPYVIEQPDELEVFNVAIENASCQNVNDGMIFLDVAGGTPPYQYDWNDGGFGFERTALSPGNYACTITDVYGCTLIMNNLIVEGKEVEPAEATPDLAVCQKDTVELKVNEAIEYEWSNGAQDQFIEIEALETEMYYVTITYENGCQAVDSVLLTVNEVPVLGDDQVLELACEEEFLVLNPAVIPGANYNYSWTALDGGSFVQTSNPWQVEVSSTGVYQLSAEDKETGCSASVTMDVQPDENFPEVNITSTGSLDCNHSEVQLDATTSSQGANYSYEWTAQDPNASIMNKESLQPTVNTPGVYQLTIRNEEAGCENSRSLVVEYGNVRHPDVSIGYEWIGDDIQFYNASRDGVLSYHWQLPDNSTSAEATPVINADAIQGTIAQLCLQAENQCGSSGLICQTIDLLDESFYFEGQIKDQFGDPLVDIALNAENAPSAFTREDGTYRLTPLASNQSFELWPNIPFGYQSSDINAADLNALWTGLLNNRNWSPKELMAGDLNEDGQISITDVIIMQSALLSEDWTHIGQWYSYSYNCFQTYGAATLDYCPGYKEIHFLQASRLNNDFLAIQKADMEQESNRLIPVANRHRFDGTHIIHQMEDWKVLATEISDLPRDIQSIYVNGEKLKPDEYVLRNNKLVILKLMPDGQTDKTVKISFDRSFDKENQMLFTDLKLYPNPAVDRMQVALRSPEAAQGSWSITDQTGRTVMFSSMNWNKGLNNWTIDTKQFNSEVCFLTVVVGKAIYREKFFVVRD